MSSTNENKALVQRFFGGVWNGRKMDSLDDLLRFPYQIENLLTGAPPERIERQEMEGHLQEWFTAFPDLKVSVRQIMAEGEKVFIETRYTGTHLGAYRGIEPTENRIDVSVLAVFTCESGKLSGHAVMVDAFGLYRQLGQTMLKPEGSDADGGDREAKTTKKE